MTSDLRPWFLQSCTIFMLQLQEVQPDQALALSDKKPAGNHRTGFNVTHKIVQMLLLLDSFTIR